MLCHTFLFRSNPKSIKGIKPRGVVSYKINICTVPAGKQCKS